MRKERDKMEHDAIMTKVADNTHKIGNLAGGQDAVELNRARYIERIVKLETNPANIEKGLAENKQEMREGFRDMKTDILDAIHARNEVTDKQIENVIDSLRVMRGG